MVVDLSRVPVQLPVVKEVASASIGVWGYVGFGLIMLLPVVITLFFFYRNRIKAFFLSHLHKDKFFYAVFRYPNKQKVSIPVTIGKHDMIRYDNKSYSVNKDAFTFEKRDLLSPTVAYQEWFVNNPCPIIFGADKYEQNSETVDASMSNKFLQEMIQGAKERLLLIVMVVLEAVILVFLLYSKYAGGVPK
jgi:hypothetical protein